MAVAACPVCGSSATAGMLRIGEMPLHCNLLWETREGALTCPKGEISLTACSACSHVFNRTFDPSRMEYTERYENSLFFSPRFQAYATALAESLIERHSLRGKDVIEIGCGKGDFLKLLCRLGGNRGVGFDPSYEPDLESEPLAGIRVVRDFYGERYSAYAADFICCRHVLEHIADPAAFIANLRRAIGPRLDTRVFFEVPNGLYSFQDLGIWDLIYEHCSYFTVQSLTALFQNAGFRVLNTGVEFDNQFLWIEAAPCPA
jgi:2-polyprenyl-3-methyl-5-hydroxy-6-metoxy-1,4-benzoquinol methylase